MNLLLVPLWEAIVLGAGAQELVGGDCREESVKDPAVSSGLATGQSWTSQSQVGKQYLYKGKHTREW